MLETKQPPDGIFRLGRRPDPWQPLDWSYAGPDGTFGNRFDDPNSRYRVLYAASQELSCYIETLARFRVNLALLAELQEIEGDNDFVPLGEVPSDWCDSRVIGVAAASGDYADIYEPRWIAFLRPKLAGACLLLGLNEIDAAGLSNAPRRITQSASSEVYKLGYPGILLPLTLWSQFGELGTVRAVQNQSATQGQHRHKQSQPKRGSRHPGG